MAYLIDTDDMVDVSRRNAARVGRRRQGQRDVAALERGLTLVTKNRKHFGMIDGIGLQVPDY